MLGFHGHRQSFNRNLRILSTSSSSGGGSSENGAKDDAWQQEPNPTQRKRKDALMDSVLESRLERALSRRVQLKSAVAGQCIVVAQSPSMRGTAPLEYAMMQVVRQYDRVVVVSVLSNYPKLPALPSE